jgi:8-oxo-dGTP pyrophosphatase MutT (NUDIX family)
MTVPPPGDDPPVTPRTGGYPPPVPPGPIKRRTARVLPVDADGRVLLLHGWDPHHPDRPFWFTIGGATEDGESLRDAAARELYEETRISVDPAQLGEPIAEQTIEFSWGGHHIVQDQVFFAVLVTSPEVSLEGLDQWEQATTDKYGWLAASELDGDERPAHPDIPDLMRAAAASVRRE